MNVLDMFKPKKKIVENSTRLTELVQKAQVASRFTPDGIQLQRHQYQHVFVYDDFQKGQNRAHLMSDSSVKMCSAFTETNNFVMLKRDLGSFSHAMAMEIREEHRFGRSSHLGTPAKIMGQMWRVRSFHLFELDRQMLNGVKYNRSKVKFDIPYREKEPGCANFDVVTTLKMEAWMYIASEEFYKGELLQQSNISAVTLYTKNSDQETQYYYYNETVENYRGKATLPT